MDSEALNSRLFSFLSGSTTPFHAVESIKKILEEAGINQLDEKLEWKVEPGKPQYFIRDDGSLIAFNIGKKNNTGFRIVGAHSDSPCLQVKPHPDIFEKSYHKLGVEVYGGALLLPWYDRELSLAGRVTFLGKDNRIYSELIDFARPTAVIPSVAIHLDRNANSEKSINAQKDILPLIGLKNQSGTSKFNDILADQLHIQHPSRRLNEILGYDLFLYDFHKPCLVGINNEFILSSRLDNLLSCFIATEAIVTADVDNSFIFVCNNHEEIGSTSSSGAQGNMLMSLLERLYTENAKRYQVLANSFFISTDNAHALHPNFPEKSDQAHDILLNVGPVLKINANIKYASSALSNALFKLLCREVDVDVQEFVMRNDMVCGSTIGPLTAAKLGLRTVDIGAASLAMHSIREMTGTKDPFYLFKVIQHFLGRDTLPEI